MVTSYSSLATDQSFCAASGAIDSPVGHMTDAKGIEFLYSSLVREKT